MPDTQDTPMLSRGRPGEKVELRGLIDRDLMDVIDAMSMADGQDRISYVAQVLRKEAVRELHRASVISRVARGNPLASDAFGADS